MQAGCETPASRPKQAHAKPDRNACFCGGRGSDGGRSPALTPQIERRMLTLQAFCGAGHIEPPRERDGGAALAPNGPFVAARLLVHRAPQVGRCGVEVPPPSRVPPDDT
jgi:hypothetical protein